jgi:hypothetical protein
MNTPWDLQISELCPTPESAARAHSLLRGRSFVFSPACQITGRDVTEDRARDVSSLDAAMFASTLDTVRATSAAPVPTLTPAGPIPDPRLPVLSTSISSFAPSALPAPAAVSTPEIPRSQHSQLADDHHTNHSTSSNGSASLMANNQIRWVIPPEDMENALRRAVMALSQPISGHSLSTAGPSAEPARPSAETSSSPAPSKRKRDASLYLQWAEAGWKSTVLPSDSKRMKIPSTKARETDKQ